MASSLRRGVGVSPGVAIGPALVLEKHLSRLPKLTLKAGKTSAELERLGRAVKQAQRDLEELQEQTIKQLSAGVAQIFEAQRMMLEDEAFLGPIERKIVERGHNAEWAIQQVGGELSRQIGAVSDPYVRERCSDIDDITRRVLRILTGEEPFSLDQLKEPVVLLAYDLSPSDAALLDPRKVLGLATDVGGRTSHTAIMARSFEIPAVVGVGGVTEAVESGETVVVDGSEGLLVLSPSATELQEYGNKLRSFAEHERELLDTRKVQSITPDGFAVQLHANIESLAEVESALLHGAEGVGLYRSEFLFLSGCANPPSEEKQYAEYREILQRMQPHPVTIRTMDFGGDKELPAYLPGSQEGNSLLGLRGIRQSLEASEIFEAQLRALLRASVHGDLRIILPFVSGVEELRAAKRQVEQARAALEEEGKRVSLKIPLGVMLEVPSAALIVDHLAPEVDFLSIGTNDLIQFVLAVDRNNERVAYLYEPLHPAVLRLLQQMAGGARDAGVPISLCGEMAADPLTAIVLLGFGIVEFSMSPSAIPVIKNVIRSLPFTEARNILETALRMKTAQEVEEFAMEQLVAHFPDGFLVRS